MPDRAVGFTGTRQGMSAYQIITLKTILSTFRTLGVVEFHHGDAMGADAEAATVADILGFKLVAHPCTLANQRAHIPAAVVWPAKPPLERNRELVDCVEALLVAPKTDKEELRSGTWATKRYAQKKGTAFILLKREEEHNVQSH
jgi:hypothetical protein